MVSLNGVLRFLQDLVWQIPLGPGRLGGGVVGVCLVPVWVGAPCRWLKSVEVELKRAVAQDAMAIEHHQRVWDGIGWFVAHLRDENTDFVGY